MIYIIFLMIVFSGATAASVLLMGSRDIIGPQFTAGHLLSLVTNWKFVVGIAFAFVSRIIFLLINNAVYGIPHLAQSSTTITFLATTVSIFVVLLVNHYFLHESLNLSQGIGAFLILVGIFFLFR